MIEKIKQMFSSSIEKFDKDYISAIQKEDPKVQGTIQQYQWIILGLKIIEKIGFVVWIYRLIDKVLPFDLFDFVQQILNIP